MRTLASWPKTLNPKPLDPNPKPKLTLEMCGTVQVALKCADLGHLANSRAVHRKWVLLLEEVRGAAGGGRSLGGGEEKKRGGGGSSHTCHTNYTNFNFARQL